MQVRDALVQLSKLPPDLELGDEYAENTIAEFYVSTYENNDGDEVEYVKYDEMEIE